MTVPQYHELFNPVLEALHELGGSATIAELTDEVAKNFNLTSDDMAEAHNGRMTVLEYRLAWARSYLKVYGLLNNSSRGVWALTPEGVNVEKVDPDVVKRFVRSKQGQPKEGKHDARGEEVAESNGLDRAQAETLLTQNWRENLLSTLQAMPPAAFERLCQRLLRESGFVQVKVTGRSGDGGIDGVGIVRIGGLLGFPVLFQCKRYTGSVSSSTIRDFRGAMIGRADRGLVLTTGTFSRDARSEATRDGAPPIDLVDGEELLDKLKELRLGVQVQLIEEVSVDDEFFTAI